MNPHLWALVTALGMFSGAVALGAVSIRGMCRAPVPEWRGHAIRLYMATAVFLLAFIPLGIWFHYNPCIAGCR